MDLTTLANAKQRLNLTVDSSDGLLARLITADSFFIETYLSRRLGSQTYAEIRDGTGGHVMNFRDYPVTAVAGVTVNGVAIPPAPDTVTPGYRFTRTQIILQGHRFTLGYGNVSLIYTAGYETPPEDLEQACIELVAFRFKERGHIGEQTASFQGQTTSFTVADLPVSVKTILDRHRRVVPV